jgi:hypothetical protein
MINKYKIEFLEKCNKQIRDFLFILKMVYSDRNVDAIMYNEEFFRVIITYRGFDDGEIEMIKKLAKKYNLIVEYVIIKPSRRKNKVSLIFCMSCPDDEEEDDE